MTLLQARDAARRQRRLLVRNQTRERLRRELTELIPGERVIIFGSLVCPGIFHDASDIDLAFEREPAAMSRGCLLVELAERMARRVDVVLLHECRFREKILREGEVWTL